MIDKATARRGLFFVFLTLLLDIMGFALIMPVLPAYLQELTGADLRTAAVEGGWLFFVYALMQFLCAPLIGNLSDRFGRRPVLLASVATFGADNLICAVAPTYSWLFVGRLLAGISGASYSTASAYIADVSTDETRAKNFGLIGIAFGLGFVVGPVVGGVLGEFGPRVPFYGAALLAFANTFLGLIMLPESLGSQNRRQFELRRASPVGALQQMRRYPGVLWIGLVFFLVYLGNMVYPSAWAFVAKYRYGWSEGEIGLSLGVFGAMSALVMALVLPRVVPWLGEWRTAVVGLVFIVLTFIGYAIAWQGWMVYLITIIGCLEGLADPALRSIAASKVPPDAQGELQGALSSVSSVTNLFGPIMMTQLFSVFTGPQAPVIFPGAPYAASAACGVLALLVLVAKVGRPSAAVPA